MSHSGAVRSSLLMAAVLAAVVGPAGQGVSAQVVTTVGSSDPALDRRLDRLLEERPLIITSDTLLGVQDTILGPVLVLDATLILEGTILGDLVAVDGGLWVRDPAFVLGDVVNIGGGLYRDRARIGGAILDLPDAHYRVIREEERFVIEASGTPTRLFLDGLAGFRVPVYDRANGVTAVWGGRYRLPILAAITSAVSGYGGWRTEPGEPVYGGSLEIRAGATVLEGGYDRTWATRDAWIRGEMGNSLGYLWDGSDSRNYYDAERRWVAVSREFGDAAKSFSAVLRLEGQLEDASSLEGGAPWTIVDRPIRGNPPVDDGRIASAITRLDLAYRGREVDLVSAIEYEAARRREGGEHRFDRLAARLRFAMHGLLDHTLEVQAYGQLPQAGDTLPRQRWTLVGGAGTLQTLREGEYRGDHVLMVESRYRMPMPEALTLPVLGAPELELVHAAGRAWLADGEASLVQEVGAGLQFFGAFVRYMLQPDDPSTGRVLVGLSWPWSSRFAWEE